MTTITPAYNADVGSVFGSTYNGNTFTAGTCGINGTNHESVVFLFNSVLLPQGCTITSAVMSVVIDTVDGDGNPALINFKASLSAADTVAGLPTTFSAWNTGVRTTHGTTLAGPTTTPASVDVTTAVQDVVNRAGWASGNNFLVYFDYASGSGTNDFTVVTSGSTFTITYTTGGGAAAAPPWQSRRRVRPWIPFRRAFTARPFPAPPVVTTQPLPVQMPRDPLRGWFFRPRRFSSTVPAANAPHLPPVQMPRDPMRGFFFRRHGFTASPVTVQVNAQPGPLVTVHSHRSQPWPLRRRTYTAEPPPTVTVTVPQQPPHRQRTPFRAKARQASPPLSIAITSAQNLPPQPPRDQRIGWLPRRRPFEARVPLLGQAPLVTVEVQQPRRRVTAWPRQRRAWRTDVVISQTPAPTTQALPPQQPRAVRIGWLPRRRSFTARVPLTGRAPNLTVLVQQPHRRTLLPPLLRHGHAASPPPIVLAFTPPQPARRTRPFPFRARARAAEPFTVTITLPPVQETPRRRPLIPRRARTASPPFAPAKTHQALPPQPATGKRHIWPILRRAKATQFVAGGQAPVGPPYPVNPGGNTGPLPGIYDSGATPVMPVNPG